MPFYEYECPGCRFYAEVLQKLSDKPLKKCPSCGKGGFKRLISAPVFRLKGSGWYETDFKSDQDRKRNLAGAGDEEAKPAAEATAAAKPDAKAAGEAAAPAAAQPQAEGAAAKTEKPGRPAAAAADRRGVQRPAKAPAKATAKAKAKTPARRAAQRAARPAARAGRRR